MRKLRKLFKFIPLLCLPLLCGLSVFGLYHHNINETKADWRNSTVVSYGSNVSHISYMSIQGITGYSVRFDMNCTYNILKDLDNESYYFQMNFYISNGTKQTLNSPIVVTNFRGYNGATNNDFFSVVFQSPISPLYFENGYTNFSVRLIGVYDYISLGNNTSQYTFYFTLSCTGYANTFNASTNVVFNDSVNVQSYSASSLTDLLLNINWNGVVSQENSDYINGYNAGYQEGYSQGYREGGTDVNVYDNAYHEGYTSGESYGYSVGYTDGFTDGQSVDSTVQTIFSGFVTVGLLPIDVLLTIFNFEILGINVSYLVSALFTICLTILLVKMFKGGL